MNLSEENFKLRRENLRLLKERNALLRGINAAIKQKQTAEEVNLLIEEWLEADYKCSEEEDRRRFAYRLTDFIINKLA